MRLFSQRSTQEHPLCPSVKSELFPNKVPAIVEEQITANWPGRVKFQGSYWPARLYQLDCQLTLHPDSIVMVVGIEGITLLVVVD